MHRFQTLRKHNYRVEDTVRMTSQLTKRTKTLNNSFRYAELCKFTAIVRTQRARSSLKNPHGPGPDSDRPLPASSALRNSAEHGRLSRDQRIQPAGRSLALSFASGPPEPGLSVRTRCNTLVSTVICLALIP